MTRRGHTYPAVTGLPFPRPVPSPDHFTDTWKEQAKPLELEPPVSVADPPTTARFWLLQSWARCIQSRASLVDTIDWKWSLTFMLCGDAYPCARGSWAQLSIGLFNHGSRGRSPAYLWVIGMVVCGDKNMATLATIWAKNLQQPCCSVLIFALISGC